MFSQVALWDKAFTAFEKLLADQVNALVFDSPTIFADLSISATQTEIDQGYSSALIL